MRKIREVFRLRYGLQFSMQKIARHVGIGETTVKEFKIPFAIRIKSDHLIEYKINFTT